MQANMGSEYWKKKVLLVRNRNINKFMIPVVIAVCGAAIFSPVVNAESALDDVTMRVIGLDEIPSSSLRIIEIPQPDLGEFADINESFIPPTTHQAVPEPASGMDSITTVPDEGGNNTPQ